MNKNYAILSAVALSITLTLAGCSPASVDSPKGSTEASSASICSTDSATISRIEDDYLAYGGDALPPLLVFAAWKATLNAHSVDYDDSKFSDTSLKMAILYGDCLSTDAAAWMIDLGTSLSLEGL